MNWFKDIINWGLVDTDSYHTKRGIIVSNYICIIISFAMLILFVINILFFERNILFQSIVGITAFITPIFFNKFLFTTISRVLVCYIPVCYVWYAFISTMFNKPVVEVSAYDGLRIYLLAISFFPYLLFDKTKWWLLVVGILPTLFSILFFEFFLKLAGSGDAQYITPRSEYELMQMRTLVAFSVISLACYGFHSIITQNDQFNQKIMAELKKKSVEIEDQNNQLNLSQSKLNEMNKHLEELVQIKTRNIKKQNEILINYSYSNAHYLRGPVARILGLIQLLKMETELDYPFFFDKVEHETIEIDNIIKRISRDLEATEL